MHVIRDDVAGATLGGWPLRYCVRVARVLYENFYDKLDCVWQSSLHWQIRPQMNRYALSRVQICSNVWQIMSSGEEGALSRMDLY